MHGSDICLSPYKTPSAENSVKLAYAGCVDRLKSDENVPAAVVVNKKDDNTSIPTTSTVWLFLIFMYSIFLLALVLLLF
ncbi:MAG: hypothetical protein WBL44_07325 [Nitrososphaeraceae archaeon]